MKGSKEEIKAIDLRSDYKVNPIGIHNVAPRLSWRMTAYGKNRKQSAYQIQVFKKESDIKEVLVWDSEKVYSGESVNIPYKGKQLASRERVYWKVRIWDEKENVSEWSEEAFFEAGLLNKTDWEAEWICAPEKAAAVYFRKVCNIEKQPKSGRLYISGLGYYEAYLNGKKCGEDVLTPNRTHYTERVFYHTYDITTAVVHGENVFGVELGNGWYNQKDKINEKKLWYGYPKLLFQIEIEYADGDKDVFISDENTKWHESPRIYNNIYFGEIYDARKESIGWREKDFEDLDWKFAGKAEKPGGELTKQKAPSDQKICELFPKKISEVTPGMYVIDFGQNMTGWVKMRVSGKEGDKVQLRFGEELWPDGKINYYSKLKTQLAAGAVPDVFYAWGGGFTKPFVEAGMVENLDPYVEDGTIDLDAMMPDICNNFYYDGSLYGLPLDSFIGVLMCNQSLFDEYGLEIPKTMDDLYAVSATFNENGITPIAMGEKDKWPGLFPFGALALRYGGVEKTITMLNGEGNFDQEFVQKTAEELQKMVDEGVFASDSVALTDDEATEEFRQGRAAMWYSGNWKVDLLCEEGSPLEGKLTMVNWPAVSGADGDQNSFVGGASATLVASATSAHKKEAVEFMTFMSEHFSNYAYEEGAILPTWKYSGDMELKPFQQTLLDLMQGADGFCLAWDTLLDPETADVHSTSLQGIYAQQMTADDYVEAMAATR